MATPANVFNMGIGGWTEEQQKPWAKLKYKIAQRNLRQHLANRPLKILDVGGDNGMDAIPLAAEGHQVMKNSTAERNRHISLRQLCTDIRQKN